MPAIRHPRLLYRKRTLFGISAGRVHANAVSVGTAAQLSSARADSWHAFCRDCQARQRQDGTCITPAVCWDDPSQLQQLAVVMCH